MAKVKVRENESFEQALRRFKRACDNEKIIQTARSKEFFEKPSQKQKKERIVARRRHLKKIKMEQNKYTKQY